MPVGDARMSSNLGAPIASSGLHARASSTKPAGGILTVLSPGSSYPVGMEIEPQRSSETRLAAARRRARSAKIGLTAAGIAFFAAGMSLAHGNVAGHSRRQARPLAAPKRFQEVVRNDALDAGLLAPAQASPRATTSVS
jgi:hypothetical protein